MIYGVFNEYNEHILTYDYGNNTKKLAEETAMRLGYGYYVRELTYFEYMERMREIFVEGKYKNK